MFRYPQWSRKNRVEKEIVNKRRKKIKFIICYKMMAAKMILLCGGDSDDANMQIVIT